MQLADLVELKAFLLERGIPTPDCIPISETDAWRLLGFSRAYKTGVTLNDYLHILDFKFFVVPDAVPFVDPGMA
jgi:hypothetical protein